MEKDGRYGKEREGEKTMGREVDGGERRKGPERDGRERGKGEERERRGVEGERDERG